MKIHVVRQVARNASKQITASEWWALVPTPLSLAHQRIFTKRGIDSGGGMRDGVYHARFYFGSHEKGALAHIWHCLQQVGESEYGSTNNEEPRANEEETALRTAGLEAEGG